MIALKAVLPFLLVGLSISSEDTDGFMKKAPTNSLRGTHNKSRKLSTTPLLGLFENKKNPSWLSNNGVSFFESANEVPGNPSKTKIKAGQAEILHTAWRDSKFPIQSPGLGVDRVFDDGVIMEIQNDGDGSDTRTIMVNPHSMCDYPAADVEAGIIAFSESMLKNGAHRYKVYLDVSDLAPHDFTPTCAMKWKGLYNNMMPSRYPLKMEKIVAYPVSPMQESSARSLLHLFSDNDEVMDELIVGTGSTTRLSNELGFPESGVQEAGGTLNFINKKKSVITLDIETDQS
eukprot:CAMPEP_0183302662 /NCGR_PEP_ID=MMETSP0160_2-20130417/8368_1 /TAXON_ID=2839 ORGANISM="Odontella Sinensis, Strain Grunow 1884" /NCGR_SAMPLE_ID=MMETSP0160_2 /ASSEMBLY_ACC=CAM_ASM_000250 /LENGTH=287 /DNA_ID=CAMNT_0025465463 /DNA_START=275 /DNA_END=1138 /DNA_ORIENTATION=+